MGQKDYAQNDYFNDKVRFADVCNGILFQGKDYVRPEDLQEMNPDIVYQDKDKEKLRKTIPDKMCFWKGIYLSVLALENQSLVDYSMVFRVMKTEAYEDFSFFKTENRELFEVLSCAKDERKMDQLLSGNLERYRNLAADAVEVIFKLTGIDLSILENVRKDGMEEVDMCKAWDDHKEAGRNEGRQEGIFTSIKNLMESTKVSAIQAMEMLQVSETERDMYLERLVSLET